MIYILTGAIQTGKTTSLLNALIGKNSIGGFLTPDVNGTRTIFDLENKKHLIFQLLEESEDAISVGRFLFSKSSMDAIAKKSIEQYHKENIEWIVIDEIGKLELRKTGFHNLLEKLLLNEWASKNLLLVVRDYLLDEVVEQYKLVKAIVIDKDSIQDHLSALQ